ncbi:MAG: SOS response-associated peptidase family protein [Schwartzia sp.]|nr:SOS response-associated peptidase family protein [Schwartzia sp. (in: firmicutes)]
MCGRYGADEKVNTWIASRCQTSSDNILRVGDIRPGERTPAIIMGRSKPLVVPMTWGIQGKSGLIINARKETIWEKPSFRHLIQNRRCLLPASCFYEWDSEKHKATLSGKDDEMLFLAGVYQAEPEGGRFVIITAPADETVRPIHDRMPVRIPESLISAWLSDADSAKELLDSATVPLRRKQAVEQMSLWEE